MARIYRDAYGIPHVRGATMLDLAHGQGEVTARDRAWQLEYLRRRATGTSAEVLGRPALAWDVLARRTRMADTARRAFEALGGESRAFVTSYVEGVNAGLSTVDSGQIEELAQLGIEPQPWEPWTPLAVFHAQHVLFAMLPAKLWQARAHGALGEEARLLERDQPGAIGSNAWAVGGARTASGFPLIGGDPHRVIESPGVYLQVRLACEDPDDPCDVVGVAFPGVPGVPHFAHAGEVAWAITNGCGDYQDVYAERLRRSDHGMEALGPDGWRPADSHGEAIRVRDQGAIEVEVITTERGPVFEGGPDEERGLSFRGASTVLGDLGFDALLPLLRSRTVDDVDRAFDHWVEPGNNVVIADRSGTVRYRLAGRIPDRPGSNRHGIVSAEHPGAVWTGWADPVHRAEVPPDGQVVTANERRGPESAEVGAVFGAPHRARRIQALLDGRQGLSTSDFVGVLDDALVPELDRWRPFVAGLRPDVAGDAVQHEILAWDGRAAVDSAGAAAFNAWRSALTRRVVAERPLADLADSGAHGPVFASYLDVTAHVGLALVNFLDGSPFGLDVRGLATIALDDAADHAATWGDAHVLSALHGFHVADPDLVPPELPRTATAGDIDTVRCTGWLPALTDECYRGSVARYVWDLADREAGGWVVPLGADGDPAGAHHHDQLPLWAAGELAPIVTDWQRLTPE